MPSSLKTLFNSRLDGSPSLLIVYVKNATPDKEGSYGCDVSEFFLGAPEFSRIDCEVVLFQYPIVVDDNFLWQDLLDSSYELLERLHSSCDDSRGRARPLIFIGESLGGLVIKQTLRKAREQMHRYRNLLDQISGVVFLTTPHLGKDEEDTGVKLAAILRQYSKAAAQRAAEKEFLQPYRICAFHFEELGLKVPILSTFETEESRSRKGRLISRKSALVRVLTNSNLENHL
jgi:PAS domain-containing protein